MGDQLVVPFPAGFAVIGLIDIISFVIERIRVDAGKRAYTTGGSPGPRTFTIRDRDALTPFDQGQGFAARNNNGIKLEAQGYTSPIAAAELGLSSSFSQIFASFLVNNPHG